MFSILSSRRWSRSQIYLFWLFAPRSFHWETDSAKINFSATSYNPFLQIHFHWKWNPISLRDNSIFIVRPFLLWLASQPCTWITNFGEFYHSIAMHTLTTIPSCLECSQIENSLQSYLQGGLGGNWVHGKLLKLFSSNLHILQFFW